MDVDDFFERLIAALDRSAMPYMVTGSYASSAHGTPRATNDIDIVIAPTADQLRALLRELPDDRYYADEVDAFEALETRSQFNERAKLASELLSSLEDRDGDVKAAWAAEIVRRAADAEADPDDEEDWRTAVDDIRREVLSR